MQVSNPTTFRYDEPKNSHDADQLGGFYTRGEKTAVLFHSVSNAPDSLKADNVVVAHGWPRRCVHRSLALSARKENDMDAVTASLSADEMHDDEARC